MANKRDAALLKIQEIDSTLDRLKKDSEQIPEKRELNEIRSQLKASRDDRAMAEKSVAAIEHSQKRLEDESKRLEDKIKNEEKKLYAGTVTNPKELMSLQQEIKVLADEKDTVDTEFLLGLDELAKAQSTESELKDDLNDKEDKTETLTETIEKKRLELEEAVAGLEEKRKTVLKDIDETTLEIYDQMRIKGRGIAVAVDVAGVCGGCNLENSEDSGHGPSGGPVRRCEYCHRILISK